MTAHVSARRLLLTRLSGLATLALLRPAHATSGLPADELAARAHALLVALESPALRPFLDEWPSPTGRRVVAPSAVPVLHWLARIRRIAVPSTLDLADSVAVAGPSLAWRRSYTAAATGARFYERYGWTEFVGLTGPVPSERVACGVLLLGPGVLYPAHRHEAEEIYVPLAGTAGWRSGAEDWRSMPPGSVIHHARHEVHAMQTGAEPLLALYVWRSADLSQHSELVT